MAEQPNEEEPQALVDSDDEAQKLAYKPPKQVTMNELLEKDKDDASLNVYKEKLLGGGDQIIICEYSLVHVCVAICGRKIIN